MAFSIRPISAEDFDWIFEACQDPEIQKWTQIPRPYTQDHAISFTRDLGGDVAVWAIVNDDSPKPFGVIGVHSIKTGVADIGYWVAPWGRRRGAAKSAINLLIDQLKTWPEVRSIEAKIGVGNLASKRVVEWAQFAQTDVEGLSCRCGDDEISAHGYLLNIKENLPLL